MTATSKLSDDKARAWSLLQDGQHEAARKIGRKLCKANKHDPQCWYLLSLANSYLKNYSAAIEGYQTVLKLSPDFPEAACNLALTYQFSGMLAEAVKYFRKAVSIQPSLVDAHYGLGSCFYSLGKYAQAADAYRAALKHNPDFTYAKVNLGIVLQELGELDAAESILLSVADNDSAANSHLHLGRLYQARNEIQKALESYTRALEIDPISAFAWTHLGRIYEVTGQLDMATKACSKAIECDPEMVEAHHGLAAVYFQTGHMTGAEQHFQKALQLNNRFAESLVGMGSIRVSQGDYEEGLGYINQALAIDSKNASARILKAKTYEQMGKLDEALEALQPIVDEDIINGAAGAVYANICHGLKKHQDGIAYLETLAKHDSLSNWDRQQVLFSLGKLYDAIGKFDDAFLSYKTGNDLKYCRYSHRDQAETVDRLIKLFPRNYSERLAGSGRGEDKTVFIVGMPRSGTSLVEQILSRHPGVTGGGELTFMHEIVNLSWSKLTGGQRYPDCLEAIGVDELNQIADEYLGKTLELREDGKLLTDKLPENFMHLGLISLLFPSAIIVHCVRNPIDTCLSCYFQDFIGDLGFAYNLEHLAHYYGEYRRLMRHWETVLELPVININYEELVQDQEKVSRKLVAFCGLEWDAQCLDHRKSDRFVRTASYDQVRRPIYNSSVERWKNYRDYVSPLLPLIEE